MNPITIVGGGLAGLSLGVALRARNIPVTVHEAGSYPRHRVCGEFIAGVRRHTLERLGIADCLEGAVAMRSTDWYCRGKPVGRFALPRNALGISRYQLDERLSRQFVGLGGDLRTQDRVDLAGNAPGRVLASGRHAHADSPWIGLKVHALGFTTSADLEIHVGDEAYVGASPVGQGRTNLCGLFRRRPAIRAPRSELFFAYLDACGLGPLRERIEATSVDPESHCGMAAVDFQERRQQADTLHLGDRYTVIPPFTGNGMSMAFESAEAAAGPLGRWAREGTAESWKDTVAETNGRVRRRFRTRLTVARTLHPWLLQPPLQRLLAFLAERRLLPFTTLFHLLH